MLNLRELKKNMWIEVCEGEEKEFSDEYRELVSGIGDEEVEGGMYVFYFYKILDILIENELIEFYGGDYDWIFNELDNCGEGKNFNKYLEEFEKMVF